jgi:hypothetical protein
MAKAKPDIRSLARAHTKTALKVLAGIMNEAAAPHTARVSAATALLDRGWGRPKQELEHSGSVDLNGILGDLDGRSKDLPGDKG